MDIRSRLRSGRLRYGIQVRKLKLRLPVSERLLLGEMNIMMVFSLDAYSSILNVSVDRSPYGRTFVSLWKSTNVIDMGVISMEQA